MTGEDDDDGDDDDEHDGDVDGDDDDDDILGTIPGLRVYSGVLESREVADDVAGFEPAAVQHDPFARCPDYSYE
eukprot:290866-Pyramimonas_sp.AAC.1